MTSLHRKLLRELWRMRGQALAIAVVIAGGVAMLIMALSSFDSLTLTRDAFYRDYRFADVFASLKRAPESLREPIEAIPGVQHVETRVVGGANLDLPGFTDPVTAELVSLPDGRNAELNRLYLRAGRLPRAGHEAEAVVSEAFAALQGFEAGSHLRRVLDEELRVVELPPAGVLLNDFLADYLGAGRGDRITVEFLEGRREVREVTVAGVVREFTGVAAYMELDALNRLLGEGAAISGALLAVQPGYRESIIASFNDVPQVLGVTDRLTAIESFYDSMAGTGLHQHAAGREHRLRRGLQQCPHRPHRAFAGTGKPARAGIHPRRDRLYPAGRAGAAHGGGDSDGLSHRHGPHLFHRPGGGVGPVPHPAGARARRLRLCRHRDRPLGPALGPDRGAPAAAARSGCGFEDTRISMNEARHWRRRLLPYLIAIAVVLGLAFAFRPVPELVDAEPVTRGYLAVTVEDEGKTRGIDRYVVSAPLAAQTRRITLEVGDRVETGQVLVTLDALPSPIQDVRTMAQARARVEAAEAALATAREEAEAARSAALHRSAEFRVRTARSELEAARAAFAYASGQDPEATGVIELRAPVSGQVLARRFESERVVQPGEAILEIGDPTALEVEVDVLSADAVRIAPGMRVLFERWGHPEPLEGRVKHIEPKAFTKVSALGVEEQRVWVIADIVSPPEQWTRLGDGYRVNARFILWEVDDALRVPTASLFRHADGWAVFVVEDGRARLRPVRTGRRAALHTEVVSGLAAGELVIVHPGREIEDGVRVRLREQPPAD